MKTPKIILGIETSCDDTALAIVQAEGETLRILSQAIASQTAIHKKWGGVVPNLARREHEKNLPVVLKKVLAKAKFSYKRPPIDLIGVTSHPGLEIALWSGINFAQQLAHDWSVPLLGVDHLEGHLLVALLEQGDKHDKFKMPLFDKKLAQSKNAKNVFPAVALIVSGGHTALFIMQDIGKYQMIGETRDDAAGECFDKTARLLGLGFPGGPAVAAAAAMTGKPRTESFALLRGKPATRDYLEVKLPKMEVKLPRPMMHTKDYDFSFSGLKTAVLYDYQKRSSKERTSKAYISAMASEIQQAICDVLIAKTIRATREYGARTVLLGGGVAANEELRAQLKKCLFKEFPRISFRAPSSSLCTDNGVMIALAAFVNWKTGKRPEALNASSHTHLR